MTPLALLTHDRRMCAASLGTGASLGSLQSFRLAPQAEPSVGQRLPALQHAPQDDLDARRRADALDPAVGPFALTVVGLIFVASRFGADLLVGPGGHGAGADSYRLEGEVASEGQLQGPGEHSGCAELDRDGCSVLQEQKPLETEKSTIRGVRCAPGAVADGTITGPVEP